MEKNDELPEAKTSLGKSALVIDKGGKREVKEFEIKTKKFGVRTRSRISFIKPTKIQFLTHDTPGQDSLQWIKLSSGKVRKIASSDKDGPFVNSHFYYEDIGDRDIDDYKYKYLGDQSVNGEDCYKVESIKTSGTKVYSKANIYVRKSDYVIVRIEFYEAGKHTKTLRNEKIQKIQGIYTPRKVVMEMYKNKKLIGKSFLYIKSVKYNVKVSDQSFKREAL